METLAWQVAARLDALDCQPFAEVVVVGGGYSGVELAAVVAERLQGRGRVKLITNGPWSTCIADVCIHAGKCT